MTDGKHFINDPTELVLESLKGLTLTYSHLALDEKQKVVYAKNTSQLRETQVTLMSGGGAGHEPAHSGYVGPGMLTAAVSGHVFASPTSSQVLSCLRRIYSPEHGTLVIVKNYTGDILNFGRAIERFKAERVSRNNEHDPKVEMVVVGDDVGVVGEESEDVGRRGLAATILVHKVAGALAAIGAPLDEVKSTAEFVCANAFTVGCALEAASVPAAGKPRHLGADQIEVGMGIHNEPGFRTTRIASARSLVSSIVDRIVSSRFLQRLPDLSERRDVVILVNNLGAVSNLEMGLVAKEAIEAVKSHNYCPVRVYCGTYMTGLAMPGVSVTLLPLPTKSSSAHEKLLFALDYAVGAPGWVNHASVEPEEETPSGDADTAAAETSGGKPGQFASAWAAAIESAYQHVVDKEPTVTRLDEEMGDGDCGKVLLAGATAVRDALKSGSLYLGDDLGMTLHQIAGLVEDAMGGTSGVIYCIFLDALAQGVGSAVAETAGNSSTEDGTGRAIADSAVEIWSSALPKALDTLYKYTTARPGHRTLIDALAPFVETFVETKGDVARAVQMADQGAKATTHMKPKRGRAVYTGSTKQIEDAGAAGLCAVLHGILEGLKSN